MSTKSPAQIRAEALAQFAGAEWCVRCQTVHRGEAHARPLSSKIPAVVDGSSVEDSPSPAPPASSRGAATSDSSPDERQIGNVATPQLAPGVDPAARTVDRGREPVVDADLPSALCPACGAQHDGDFMHRRCGTCGHVWATPRNAEPTTPKEPA